MLKKVSFVLVGYGVAHVLLMLSSPVLSRIYSVKDFGFLGLCISITGFILPVSSLRYEYALPLLKNIRLKFYLLKACKFLISFISVIGVVALYFFNKVHPIFENNILYYTLIGAVFYFQSIIQLMNLYLISNDFITKISIGKILQNLVVVLMQFIFAYLFLPSGIVLIAALLIGLILNALYLRKRICYTSKSKKIDVSRAFFLLRYFKRFPVFTCWGDLLNSLTSNIPMFFFVSFFGAQKAGLFFFANSVFSAPISLIGTAVSQVALKDFSDRIICKKSILREFCLVSAILGVGALLYFIICWYLADYAALIFGEKWRDLTLPIRYLALPISCMFISSPLSILLNSLGRSLYLLGWQVLFFILTLFIFLGGGESKFIALLEKMSYLWSFAYVFYWVIIFYSVLLYEKNIPLNNISDELAAS